MFNNKTNQLALNRLSNYNSNKKLSIIHPKSIRPTKNSKLPLKGGLYQVINVILKLPFAVLLPYRLLEKG